MLTNIEFPHARDLLVQTVCAVGAERVDLESAYGRVLAENVTAIQDVPPFDRSAYDGYAFRSADSADVSREHPVTLRILEEVAAGAVGTQPCSPGTAVKILTGAPIPVGADAVVMYEKTSFTATEVCIFSPVKRGDNIVRAGEDVRKGQLLARAGTRIDPALLGTLAAQGIQDPLVYRRPRVGILSTGNEVVELGTALRPGKIYNSNYYTLLAALKSLGCEPVYLGLTGDNVEALTEALRRGLETCDAVLSTGGVSAGDYDLTPEAMERAGVTLLIRGVRIKPGMACAYGECGGKLVCGLSGNPASSLTSFYAVVQPALKKLCGEADALPEDISVRLTHGFPKKSPVTRLLRGKLRLTDGSVMLETAAEQGNVVQHSSIGCDAMAVIPAGSASLEAGTELQGFRF